MDTTTQQMLQWQLCMMELFLEKFSTPTSLPSETKITKLTEAVTYIGNDVISLSKKVLEKKTRINFGVLVNQNTHAHVPKNSRKPN